VEMFLKQIFVRVGFVSSKACRIQNFHGFACSEPGTIPSSLKNVLAAPFVRMESMTVEFRFFFTTMHVQNHREQFRPMLKTSWQHVFVRCKWNGVHFSAFQGKILEPRTSSTHVENVLAACICANGAHYSKMQNE